MTQKHVGIESLPQTLKFLISLSFQPNVLDLRYFLVHVWNIKVTWGCKDIGIIKLEFVAKIEFL